MIGHIQQGLNVATSRVLYQIHVSGTTDKPVATARPAPWLSNSVNRVSDFINDKERQQRLSNLLSGQEKKQQ